MEEHWEDSVSAVRGVDGRTLWTYSVPQDLGVGYRFPFAVPAGDLDGDGGDDVLVLSVEAAHTELGGRWTISYAAVRGTDGTEIWRQRYENTWVWADALVAGAYLDIDFAIPLALADVDGDGAVDLLHGRYDIRYVYATVAEPVDREEARYEVLSGRTGEVISAFEESVEGGFTYANLVPDLDGDGGADVVGIVSTWSDPGTLTARAGSTGRPLWHVALEDGFVLPWGRDLTGDGLAEVLLWTVDLSFNGSELRFSSALRVLTSAGAPLWGTGTVDGLLWADPAGDITGDGGDDLLYTLDTYSFEEGFQTIELSAAEGSTGETIWSRPGTPPEYGYPAGDLDGDGVLDPVLVEETPEMEEEGILRATALSGADGSVRWSVEGPGGFPFPLRGDLDGDGGDDLLGSRWAPESQEIIAMRGVDGTNLWPEPRTIEGTVYWIEVAEIRRADRGDLLESGIVGWPHQVTASFTGARSGEDGAALWQRRHDA